MIKCRRYNLHIIHFHHNRDFPSLLKWWCNSTAVLHSDIIPPVDMTSCQSRSTHRIRMASSPSGSLLLFLSASLAFFFFLRLILSFSLLDRTRSWWAVCCIQAFVLLSSSSLVTLGRCLALTLPLLSASRRCLTLLITKTANRGSTSRRPTAMATTAHIHAGVGSFNETIKQIIHFTSEE